MKISQDESLRTPQVSPAQPPVSLDQVGTSHSQHKGVHQATPAAQVELSSQAQALSASKAEAAKYLPAVQAAPETREDLVSKLKTQVESGSYHISSADIADKILQGS